MFVKSMPTSSVAINVHFLGIIGSEPNLKEKINAFFLKKSLWSY